MKKLWTLCTCCLSVGMMWAQTGNWTDEGNYDTSWWDGNNRSEYHITTAEQLAGLSYLSQQGTTFLQSRIVLDNDLDMGRIIGHPSKNSVDFSMVTGIPCPEYRYKPVWGIPALSPLYKAIMAIPNMEWCMT